MHCLNAVVRADPLDLRKSATLRVDHALSVPKIQRILVLLGLDDEVVGWRHSLRPFGPASVVHLPYTLPKSCLD